MPRPHTHMAVTDMVGPWKSYSRMNMVSGVEDIMFIHVLGLIRVAPER